MCATALHEDGIAGRCGSIESVQRVARRRKRSSVTISVLMELWLIPHNSLTAWQLPMVQTRGCRRCDASSGITNRSRSGTLRLTGFARLRALAKLRGGFPPENASDHLGTIAASRFLEQTSYVILYGRMRNKKTACDVTELRSVEQLRQYFDLARCKTEPEGAFRQRIGWNEPVDARGDKLTGWALQRLNS